MDPVPYEVREDDVDEVLGAYESVGGSWTPEDRAAAVGHVMRHVLEIDETVRTSPEDRRIVSRGDRALPEDTSPGEDSPRREMALAVIEDILIRDGFIDVGARESRVFPVSDRTV